jgi:dipeptidyl-peptidase-4
VKFPRFSNLVLPGLAMAAVCCSLIAQQTPADKSLTVERISEEHERNQALPYELEWSPARKLLTYIRTEPKAGPLPGGTLPSSEIWSFDPATGMETVLVSAQQISAALGNAAHKADDEDDETARKAAAQLDYAWAPDGHALLLAGGFSLAWFDVDAHSFRHLLSGDEAIGDAKISPDGQWVSFVRGHALWVVDGKTGAVRAFSPKPGTDILEGEPDWAYSHELGLKSGYWWSPDSSSIAWIETDDRAVDKYSNRSADGVEHSIAYPKPGGAIPAIHVFTQAVSAGKPVRMDIDRDPNLYIPRVHWLPDGKHLAIERLSRDQKTLELLLADGATGSSKVILTDKDAYWINLGDELHFLKDSHRFLWSSERSGYRHLYLYDTSGQQLAQLTQGNWEVTSLVGVGEAAGAVFFTATAESPLQRQLYRVNMNGQGFGRVTREGGTHDVHMLAGSDTLVDIWSSQMTPPSLSLLHFDGTKIKTLTDSAPFKSGESLMRPAEFLTVKNHMGTALDAWMMKPPDFDPARRYPVIVYIAGGPGEQIVRDQWGGEISLWFSMMARKGYVVFALDGRGSSGHGHLFEEPVHQRLGGTEMADQRDGIHYLRSLPFIDPARIGGCGWGYGGFMTVTGMMGRPSVFKAGFAGSPITDWHLFDAVFTERYLGDPTLNQDGWLSSSPLDNAAKFSGPLLLAQATLDERVHPENAMALLDALLDESKYADILLFPDRKDLFEDRGARLTLFRKLTDFFAANL